jgi:hypothetical protein
MTQAEDRKYVELMSQCLTRVLADFPNNAPQLAFDKTLQGIENDAKHADADFAKLHWRLEKLVQMLKVADDGKGGKIYNPERKQRLCDKLAP